MVKLLDRDRTMVRTGITCIEGDDMASKIPERAPYRLSLRFDHPTMSGQEITRTFGVAPDFSHSAGEPRQTPKGTHLSGTYSSTYWLHRMGGYEDSDGAADAGLVWLEARLPLLHGFRQTGGTVSLIMRRAVAETNGFQISGETTARLGELGVGVGFEVLISWSELGVSLE